MKDVVRISTEALSVDQALANVRRPHCGAIALFLGTVRNHFEDQAVRGMEYEAHTVLAERTLQEIAHQVRLRWPIGAIAISHRVGRLKVGDISVVIAVSSPHRQHAFEACHYAIDTLKQTAPIWKKELFEDGAVWIEGDERVDVVERGGLHPGI